MEFASIPWAQGGAVVVLAAVAWLVYTGKLVPVSVVEKLMAAKDQRITEKTTEASEWKAAWESAEAGQRESTAQMGELLEMARTSNTFIQSLQSIAHRDEGARDALEP